ncbi:hypothetical protein FBU30_002089 [Linnemannia zychae]|nr:hypothetical protein FBU30_002089 [Linnemannia zychae]
MDGLPPEFLRMMQAVMMNSSGQAGSDVYAGSGPGSNPAQFLGGMPMPSSFPTAAEVRKEARGRVTNIFKDWRLLNSIVLRHEDTIQKRWFKKTREQRKSILLAAWPNMSAAHRPDIEAFVREKSHGPAPNKEPYLWPYINQEDLLKPKLFLTFLNARARNFPSAFSAADETSFQFATTSRKVMAAFLNEYTMMFTGRNTPETYGQLYSWDEHEDAFDWQMTQRGMRPGFGLQILEVQERIYHFLLSCCLRVLHEIPFATLMSDDSPVKPEPPALSIIEENTSTLAAVIATTPYRLPARINLARLQDLIATQRSAAEDHIWSLREDPSYFTDCILEVKEHRQELLPDTRGQPHSEMKPQPSKVFWDRVAGNVVSDAYLNLEIWDDLHSQIGKVITLMEKHKNNIKYEKDLPKELLHAFLDLEFSLTSYMRGPIEILKKIVVASPPLRSSFVRMPEVRGSTIIQVTQKSGTNWDKTKTRLMWLFQCLWDDQQRHLFGLSSIIEEMTYLMENKSNGKDLFSSYVSSKIADLLLLSECQRQISLFEPWASTFENDAASREDELKRNYMKRTSRLQDIHTVIKKVSLATDPSDGKFLYPVEKRRTKENTEAMQKAEKNLDAFWEKLDKSFMQIADVKNRSALTDLLSNQRILHRTLDWMEPDLTVPPADRQGENNIQEVEKPLSQLFFDNERRTQGKDTKVEKATQKTKVKTRGVAHSTPSPNTLSQQADATQPIDIQPTFTVDKRAMKVFSTLFYTPSSSAQPGEIPWNDFLHAMSLAGFVFEKLYGSIWHFMPSKLDVERSIQFHEPHPVSKIPFKTARRFGRRLFRAYGWRGDMFKMGEAE